MDFNTLQKELRELSDLTKPKMKLTTAREQEILAKTVKLNEEVGELCNDILSILQLQRQSKLDKFDKTNIYQEFADVILTTMQLADAARVDVDRAVRDKIKTIKKRESES